MWRLLADGGPPQVPLASEAFKTTGPLRPGALRMVLQTTPLYPLRQDPASIVRGMRSEKRRIRTKMRIHSELPRPPPTTSTQPEIAIVPAFRDFEEDWAFLHRNRLVMKRHLLYGKGFCHIRAFLQSIFLSIKAEIAETAGSQDRTKQPLSRFILRTRSPACEIPALLWRI